jgi:hypothetical protein
MRALLLAIAAVAIGAGCATPTTTVFLLGREQQQWLGDANYQLEYVGSRDYFHYLRLSHGWHHDTYRVSTFELAVDQAFPLGAKRVPVRWHLLDEYLEERRQALAGQEWTLEPDAHGQLVLRLRPSRGATAH